MPLIIPLAFCYTPVVQLLIKHVSFYKIWNRVHVMNKKNKVNYASATNQISRY